MKSQASKRISTKDFMASSGSFKQTFRAPRAPWTSTAAVGSSKCLAKVSRSSAALVNGRAKRSDAQAPGASELRTLAGGEGAGATSGTGAGASGTAVGAGTGGAWGAGGAGGAGAKHRSKRSAGTE